MKDLETIILPVLEMSCAVCANNVENTVKGLPGVEEASVNFAANTLSVKYHPSLITPQKMREAVQEAGYDLVVEVEDPTAVQEEMAREHYRKLRRNTIGAWVLSIPLALLGMVFMHTPGGNWIMMALALVIMELKHRSISQDAALHLRLSSGFQSGWHCRTITHCFQHLENVDVVLDCWCRPGWR